jgi:hypothetical protein
MKRKRLFCAIVGSALACCVSATAQDKGYWRAANSTAQSITGDVALSDAKILINFSSFDIVHARDLAPGEVSSVFDADSSAGNKGNLYKLNIPASKKMMHKNTLCGAETAQWMVTYVDGRSLRLAFFSSEKAPVFTLDAVTNSTDLCGTFSYTR